LENYITSSLNVAAFLRANGIKVIRVEKQNDKAIFHFPKSPEVKVLVDMYLSDSALKRFISAFKEVKDMAIKSK
jgi:hypothetical protein